MTHTTKADAAGELETPSLPLGHSGSSTGGVRDVHNTWVQAPKGYNTPTPERDRA